MFIQYQFNKVNYFLFFVFVLAFLKHSLCYVKMFFYWNVRDYIEKVLSESNIVIKMISHLIRIDFRLKI